MLRRVYYLVSRFSLVARSLGRLIGAAALLGPTPTGHAAGYVMARIQMATAPFLMGFILGRLSEDNLRRTFLISDSSAVFSRAYICWTFLLITLISLAVGVRREPRGNKSKIEARALTVS